MQSSLFRYSTFLLSATVIVSFDTPKTALADPPRPPGPNPRFLTPVTCDYPNDDTILSDFTGTDPDETLVFVDLDVPSNGEVAEFCFLYQLKSVFSCFPLNYLSKGSRSDRWYLDFYYRFQVIFTRAARGWVYLLSRPDGPRDSLTQCRFWFRVQFPIFRATEAVQGIIMVNVKDYEDQWIYWTKGDGDQPRRRPIRGGDDDGSDGNGNGRDSNGNGNGKGPYDNGRGGDGNGNRNGNSDPLMNVVTGVVGGAETGWTNLQMGVASLGVTALEGWRAHFGGINHPTMPAGDDFKDRKDQLDPGIKTDVLDLKTGELPDMPDGIDEKPTVVSIDPTSTADELETNDGTSQGILGIGGVLNTDEIGGNSNPATTWNLFGRDRFIRRSRAAVGFCNSDDWVDDPWSPNFPDYAAMIGRPGTLSSPASSYGLLYPFVPGELATVSITQYDKQFDAQRQSVDYHLDITVRDSGSNVLFAVQLIAAPSGKEITVDAHLNFLLHVGVDDAKEKPISIRYGDPLLLNSVNGAKWSSDDQSQDHRCTTDPTGSWEDKRLIMCFFKM